LPATSSAMQATATGITQMCRFIITRLLSSERGLRIDAAH
jgi:hypothetical protein